MPVMESEKSQASAVEFRCSFFSHGMDLGFSTFPFSVFPPSHNLMLFHTFIIPEFII
jgi:hypothetical protein